MLGVHGRSVTRAVCELPARGLARLGVRPNHVTIAGTCLTVVAAVGLLATGHLLVGPWVLGVILLADSLDGTLARLRDETTRFGAFLDSSLDRIGDGAVFASLTAWAIMGMPGGAVRAVAIAAGLASVVGAAAVPYVRARGEAFGITAAVGIAERTDRLVVALVCCFFSALFGWPWLYALGLVWVALACVVTVVQRIVYVAQRLDEE